MSSTELVEQIEPSIAFNLPIKSILKSSNQIKLPNSAPRIDWAGNEITKGGLHKIAFTANYTTPNSEHQDSVADQDECDQEVSEQYERIVECRKLTEFRKRQPEINESSSCCCIF